jgi:hypothetical protein
MKRMICVFILWANTIVFAENYLINGGQQSRFNYTLKQKVVPPPQTSKLVLSFVVPQTFSSPTYNQKISNFALTFSTKPKKQKTETDKRGNTIITAEWKNPHTIRSSITLTAQNTTKLVQLQTQAPFPPKSIPGKIKDYLSSSDQVPTKNALIQKKAKEITRSAKTQFDAVQQILSWLVDHMHYVLKPEKYDALYSFKTGKGNCQNYSHLSAALMRAVGIPVRIVNGITLDKTYDIKTEFGVMTMKMAQGRHSWIEVYFADLGWVPFDPQQLEMFVSNRFIRAEIGVDNDETEKDGLIRWTTDKGINLQPLFEETIETDYVLDNVNLTASKQSYGPQKMLFCPQVDATFSKKQVTPPPPPPPPISDKKIKSLRFIKPYYFGNLEFPKNLNFASSRGHVKQDQSGENKLRKDFIVETAEYVTTRGNQFAQTFILKKPMSLRNVGLALNIFGGNGQFWIELYKDDGRGKPGDYLVTSNMLNVNGVSKSPGYDWVNFDFSSKQILQPGRYWIAFGFTGSPVINWFFSYGKPVGPADGTRYKTMFDDSWGRSLAYEFNYRVAGFVAE